MSTHTTTTTNGSNGTTNGANGTDGSTRAKDAAPAQASAPVVQQSDLPARVQETIGYVKMAASVLAIEAPAMSVLDRRRLGKVRKGGEAHYALLAELAQEWGVAVRTQPTATMGTAAATVTTLKPLLGVLEGFLQQVQDTNAVAASDAWSTANVLYSVLKRMSRKDPALKARLAPVTEFFAHRRQVTGTAADKVTQKKQKKLADAEALIAKEKGSAQVPVPSTLNGVTPNAGASKS